MRVWAEGHKRDGGGGDVLCTSGIIRLDVKMVYRSLPFAMPPPQSTIHNTQQQERALLLYVHERTAHLLHSHHKLTVILGNHQGSPPTAHPYRLLCVSVSYRTGTKNRSKQHTQHCLHPRWVHVHRTPPYVRTPYKLKPFSDIHVGGR